MEKISKYTFEGWMAFLLAPFLGVPLYLLNIYRGNRASVNFFSLIIGLISYLYIPSVSNDKVRYIERYVFFEGMGFGEFSWYLIETKRVDFVFEYLLYFLSNLGFPIQLFFFGVTYITIFNIFWLIRKFAERYYPKTYSFMPVFLISLLCLSYPAVFSGIRFTFATSLLLVGIYYCLVENKKIGLLFLFVSVCTHISLLIILPVLVVYRFTKKWNLKVLVFVSFSFFLLPKDLIQNLVGFLELGDGLSTKTDLYFGENDIVSQAFVREASVVAFHLKLMPVYLGFIYLLLRRSNFEEIFVKISYIYIAVVNITFAFPTVFERFSLITKILLVLVILYDVYLNKRKHVLVLFIVPFAISTLVELNQIRFNLTESLFQAQNLMLYGILTNSHSLYDVIRF